MPHVFHISHSFLQMHLFGYFTSGFISKNIFKEKKKTLLKFIKTSETKTCHLKCCLFPFLPRRKSLQHDMKGTGYTAGTSSV